MARQNYTTLLANLADNTTGSITAAHVREIVESVAGAVGFAQTVAASTLVIPAPMSQTTVPLDGGTWPNSNVIEQSGQGLRAKLAGVYTLTCILKGSIPIQRELYMTVSINGVLYDLVSVPIVRTDSGYCFAAVSTPVLMSAGTTVDLIVMNYNLGLNTATAITAMEAQMTLTLATPLGEI